MSLFCDNIKSDLPGQKWMRENINWAASCYLNDLKQIAGRRISYSDDREQMKTIRSRIISCWVCNPALIEFNISGTDTLVIHSSTSGYKYEVIVNVRFEGETDMEHYIEYVRVPIIKETV